VNHDVTKMKEQQIRSLCCAVLYSALHDTAESAHPVSHPVRYSFCVMSTLESLCAGISQFNVSKEQYLGGRNESLDRVELL
jgi:type 1 glutamine amidotransferase